MEDSAHADSRHPLRDLARRCLFAYQTLGEGPLDIVWQIDWPGNIGFEWDEPLIGPFFREFVDTYPGFAVARSQTSPEESVVAFASDRYLPRLDTPGAT